MNGTIGITILTITLVTSMVSIGGAIMRQTNQMQEGIESYLLANQQVKVKSPAKRNYRRPAVIAKR